MIRMSKSLLLVLLLGVIFTNGTYVFIHNPHTYFIICSLVIISFWFISLNSNQLNLCISCFHFSHFSNVANVNDQGCNHYKNCSETIPHHYYELGCQPIYNETNCCPIRFVKQRSLFGLFCYVYIVLRSFKYKTQFGSLSIHDCKDRFECPKLVNDGKCHVHGNTYNLNEKLSDSDEPLCSAACYCAKTIE